MLEKRVIREVTHCKVQCFSSLLLVSKKDGRQGPVINLKELNTFMPDQHLKMEGLDLLKEILEQGDYLCNLDLKDAYFIVPLSKQLPKWELQ